MITGKGRERGFTNREKRKEKRRKKTKRESVTVKRGRKERE